MILLATNRLACHSADLMSLLPNNPLRYACILSGCNLGLRPSLASEVASSGMTTARCQVTSLAQYSSGMGPYNGSSLGSRH